MSYTSLITSQHQQPDFLAVVSGLTQPFVDLQAMVIDLNVNTALGWELDLIGQWVGLNRTIVLGDVGVVLSDAQYRTFLQMTIIANSWNGTKESAYNALSALNLYTLGDLTIYDNQDMTMTICLQGTALQGFLIELIINGIIPLRPFAVYLKACTKLNQPVYFGIGLYSTEICTLF